jgi:HEAT repeat protein
MMKVIAPWFGVSRSRAGAAFLALLSGFLLQFPVCAQTSEEDLIAILQSDKPETEKVEACAKLRLVGTDRAVPALAELLTNDELSHSARYVLESMRGDAAGQALRAALEKTSGSNQVGIINSLAVRRDTEVVPVLGRLEMGADSDVAVAAAEALGRIGGVEAADALQSAWTESSAVALHNVQSDGLLVCANRYLAEGGKKRAEKIFQELYDHETSPGMKTSAFRGLVLSSGKRGIDLMLTTIQKADGPSQGAALHLASTVGGASVTEALAKLLAKSSPALQIALLQCLQQRGDQAASPCVAEMLQSTDADVRMAAIQASGDLGTGAVALPLARLAASATGAEKTAAREALVGLRHGAVTGHMLKSLNAVSPDVQAELIRALGSRGDVAAAPKLMELARSNDDSLRSASLQALALLAGLGQVPDMVRLVTQAANDDARSEAADALGSACQHIEAQQGRLDLTSLTAAARSAGTPARVALLGVCGGLTALPVREVLRVSVQDTDEQVRAAAIRALCESQDAQLLPDMLSVAGTMKAVNFRMLGIRGAARMVTQAQPGEVPVPRKIETLKELLAVTFNAEGKRLVLSALASVPDEQTLQMAVSLLDNPETKVEASQAVITIVPAISKQHPNKTAAALRQILKEPANDAIRNSAEAALKKIRPAK